MALKVIHDKFISSSQKDNHDHEPSVCLNAWWFLEFLLHWILKKKALIEIIEYQFIFVAILLWFKQKRLARYGNQNPQKTIILRPI